MPNSYMKPERNLPSAGCTTLDFAAGEHQHRLLSGCWLMAVSSGLQQTAALVAAGGLGQPATAGARAV